LKKQDVATLVEKHGQRYSELLGVNLKDANDKEVFKWLKVVKKMGFGLELSWYFSI